MRFPGNWSRTQPAAQRHAPRYGEHTQEVLREAGLDESEIDRLARAQVIAMAIPDLTNEVTP